ncbi:hypothetical protein CDAR_212561 [Caerostris darwini]|uniref:SWIM-type domain-containing protein n=1 Tax=Caerostris darwini TaxID=1538125 RepID=A0AAV4PYG9_9ARAC|nr:hypothetical protein CDAR_212561 [Caerostris darwini]
MFQFAVCCLVREVCHCCNALVTDVHCKHYLVQLVYSLRLSRSVNLENGLPERSSSSTSKLQERNFAKPVLALVFENMVHLQHQNSRNENSQNQLWQWPVKTWCIFNIEIAGTKFCKITYGTGFPERGVSSTSKTQERNFAKPDLAMVFCQYISSTYIE